MILSLVNGRLQIHLHYLKRHIKVNFFLTVTQKKKKILMIKYLFGEFWETS